MSSSEFHVDASSIGTFFIVIIIAHEGTIDVIVVKVFSLAQFLFHRGNINLQVLDPLQKVLDFIFMLVVGFTCFIL